LTNVGGMRRSTGCVVGCADGDVLGVGSTSARMLADHDAIKVTNKSRIETLARCTLRMYTHHRCVVTPTRRPGGLPWQSQTFHRPSG